MKFVPMTILYLLLSLQSFAGFEAGPVYQWHQTEDTEYQRALGPFLERNKRGGHEMAAVRPLWSIEQSGPYKAQDFLWPLGQRRTYHDHLRSHYLLFFHNDSNIQDPKSQWMSWLIPFFYCGRSSEGQGYVAVWPFWGRAYDIVGYDWIEMKFFPFYCASRRNSVYSQSWAWPIYSHAEGDDVTKFRVWPFYGQHTKHNVQVQNWAAWPFVHWGKDLRPDKSGDWYFVFPFYGHWRSQEADKKTLLWPFFVYEKYVNGDYKIAAPWPFYGKQRQTIKGQAYTKTSYWPFWEESTFPEGDSKTLLWPLMGNWNYTFDGHWQKRRWFVPFYWDYEKGTDEAGLDEKYRRYWPFCSILEKGDMKSIRILDLWPGRRMPAVERNWAPLWTLYRCREDKSCTKHDLLWGLWGHEENLTQKSSAMHIAFLYEQESAENGFGFSLLKGLFATKSQSDKERSYRLLWFINWGGEEEK